MADARELEAVGREMAGRVAGMLRTRARTARTVTVTLRYADFQTVTARADGAGATDDEEVIWRTARTLVSRALEERDGALRCSAGCAGAAADPVLTDGTGIGRAGW